MGSNWVGLALALPLVGQFELECLKLAIIFQSSLTLLVKQGAYPRRKHLK